MILRNILLPLMLSPCLMRIEGGRILTESGLFAFFYNYELKRMYVDLSLTDAWRYLDPNGDWAATDISLPVGELSFALAYNMKFYDSYDDAFYGRI